MSRSGYSDDCENVAMWRGQVASAIRGKRGQTMLRDLVLAQEVMYENDEGGWRPNETPEERWARVRNWAAKQIRVTPEEAQAVELPDTSSTESP